MARLDGKVALVTGAATGIGKASALMLAREGAKVAVADIDVAGGEAVVRAIAAVGGEAIFVRTDVTSADSVEAAVQASVRAFGGLTTLHNNAGGSSVNDNTVVDAAIEEFWRAINLDLFGTFLCSRFAIPEMRKAGGGSIINMAAGAGLVGIRALSCYTSAKGGVIGLTRSMAADFGPYNIRVNAIAPGIVATERVVRLTRDKPAAIHANANQVLGVGHPDEIASMVAWLASDESRFATGAIFPLDGGFTGVRVQ
jgi:NAD(P)-dependent dehydrogenase (short-subunit alcohol dehydrogenase family)